MISTKSIEIELQIRSNISKQAKLRGFAYLDAGFLVGDIIDSGHGLSRTELVLATAFTFTGCPIAARTGDPDINPWLQTNGEYIGSRSLRLADNMIVSRISAHSSDGVIRMSLEIDAPTNLPELGSIHKPFQEQIRQRTRGIFDGEFDLCFCTSSGELISAHAKSEYRLKIDSAYPPVWRNITILSTHVENHFSQIEQIDMFSDRCTADADLRQKICVFST